MSFADLRTAVKASSLDVLGAFHPRPEDLAPDECATLVLLGPGEPGFWSSFTQSPEWQDKQPDPMDRWSQRVVSALARTLDATALFPFGGPPYQPFFRWALASGHAWQSPVSLLVDAKAGLMVSYRGALALPYHLELPAPPPNPCKTCQAKPCLTACPSEALTAAGYDVPKCHTFLDTDAGAAHLEKGCNVRRACPLSQTYARVEAQSAYHMSVFHKGATA